MVPLLPFDEPKNGMRVDEDWVWSGVAEAHSAEKGRQMTARVRYHSDNWSTWAKNCAKATTAVQVC